VTYLITTSQVYATSTYENVLAFMNQNHTHASLTTVHQENAKLVFPKSCSNVSN